MQKSDLSAVTTQRRRRFHPQHATANHHRRAGYRQNTFHVRQSAEGHNLRTINALQRRDKGPRTGGEHQLIPRQPGFRDAQPPLLNIDFIDRLARPQAHPVPGVPLRRQQRDLRRRFSPASSGES